MFSEIEQQADVGFQENKFFFPCYAIKDQTIPVCSKRFTEEIN